MSFLKRYSINTQGRDFVVGDIHGHFSQLESELKKLGFNYEKDRLFSVGDLVDRGPESHEVINWLYEPWFHAVRGNHDDWVVDYKLICHESWIKQGGLWFQSLLECEKQEVADLISVLPFAIEVETDHGVVGIVHADPIVDHWSSMETFLQRSENRQRVMWSRTRSKGLNPYSVLGIQAVVVGHTVFSEPVWRNNVLHIDTGPYIEDGKLTIMNIRDIAKESKKYRY